MIYVWCPKDPLDITIMLVPQALIWVEPEVYLLVV